MTEEVGREWMTVKETAEFLRMSVQTFYRNLKCGVPLKGARRGALDLRKIPTLKVSGRVLFSRPYINEFAQGLQGERKEEETQPITQ